MSFVKAGLSVWRLLPETLRSQARNWFLSFGLKVLVRAADRNLSPATQDEPVIGVAGFLTSTIGLGEGARLCADCIESAGFEVSRINLTPLLPVNPDKTELFKEKFTYYENVDKELSLIIIHVNPPQLALILIHMRPSASLYRIGYWAWELDTAPAEWKNYIKYFNEIWAPSEFAANSIRALGASNVLVVPHPMMSAPIQGVRKKSHSKFSALFAYDERSCHARKNPEAVIEAFKRAFPVERDVTLSIKISGSDYYPAGLDLVKSAIKEDPRVSIIIERMSDGDMHNLILFSDVIISLHRSEGFGLLLARGLLLGKMVIGTSWSGNLDFMSSKNSRLVPYTLVRVADPQGLYLEGVWAEPDITAAASYLKECYDDRQLLQEIGEIARRTSIETLEKRARAKLIDRIRFLTERAPTPSPCT